MTQSDGLLEVYKERGDAVRSKGIVIHVLIDGLGFRLLERIDFLNNILLHRQALRPVLGYSSACVPSIVTGAYPNTHGVWSYFYYSPQTSPFKGVNLLSWVPPVIGHRNKFREPLMRWIRYRHGYTSVLSMFKVPFKLLPLLDFALDREVFAPGSFTCGSLFDWLQTKAIPYRVFSHPMPEARCCEAALQSIEQERYPTYFIYLPRLDYLQHRDGTAADTVATHLHWYAGQLKALYNRAQELYTHVILNVFSDHGMTDIITNLDVMSFVRSLPFKVPQDYLAIFDSTMVRIYLLSDRGRGVVQALDEWFAGNGLGRRLTDTELQKMGIFWPNHRYGDVIFLLNPGVLLTPSHMGHKPMKGMHGYDPADPASAGVFLSTEATSNLNDQTKLLPVLKSHSGFAVTSAGLD